MLKNFLRKPAESAHATLGDAYGTDYVRSVVLEGIDDPFNAALLWHRAIPMMGGGNLAKAFLASHPYHLGASDFIHAHVHIEIPPYVMAWDQNVAKGVQSVSLIRELVKLHQHDFGKRLPTGVSPRYVIRAGLDLAPRSVRIRIGHTIYVPDAGEVMAWRLEGSRDGIIFEPLGELGQMQRLAMLGADVDSTSIQIDKWPWGDRHSLLIINNPDAEGLGFHSEPYGSLEVERDDNLGHYVVARKGGKETYILRARRLIPPIKPGKPEIRLLPDPPKAEAPPSGLGASGVEFDQSPASILVYPRQEEHGSVMPDASPGESVKPDDSVGAAEEGTVVPLELDQSRHAMKLVGLALQRVSLYKSQGVVGMGFGFDRAGQLFPPRDPRSHIHFHIGSGDQIVVVTGNGKRQVQPGEKLPLSAEAQVQFDAAPQEMSDRYAALCRLPIQLTDHIGTDACFSVGRDRPVLKSLRPLSRKGYIEADTRWASADRMGLSRKAFAMEVAKDGLAITQISDNQVLYHLDEALGFIARIDKNSNQPFTLPSGHHLVAGPYVWRYEA